MGYNLYIGEFDVNIDYDDRYVCATVKSISSEEGVELGAPLNSSDFHSNFCWPSYTAWSNFCREVGLTRVFFGGACRGLSEETPLFVGASGQEHRGLIIQHPGAVALHPDHRHAFYEARQRYRTRPTDKQDEYVNRRLDWLVWWTDWALKNCKYPTFGNS